MVKYYAPWCKACLNIKHLYERAAEGPMGEHADFYEVRRPACRWFSGGSVAAGAVGGWHGIVMQLTTARACVAWGRQRQ